MVISVIIPTYNRLSSLIRCLDSISQSNFDKKTEIIIIDDHSAKKVRKYIPKYQKRFQIKILRNSKQMGPAHCRNKGISVARGEIIAFTDDDCIVDKHWLTQIYDSHKKFSSCAIGGQTFSYSNKFISKFWEFLTQFTINKNSTTSNNQTFVQLIPTYNCSYKRHLFEKIGMFDSTNFTKASGEDTELNLRILEFEKGILYNPKMVVHHDFPSSLKSSLIKTFQYGVPVSLIKNRHPQINLIGSSGIFGVISSLLIIPLSILKKIFFIKKWREIAFIPMIIVDEIVYRISVIWGIFIKNVEKD